jgi:hypothetical protein
MGHELQSSKPASPYRWMHSYLATNDLRVCVFLMDMLQTYLNWWIYRMIDDYMEWKVIIVMYLYKHFFHLIIRIYCQKRYGIYLWRWISFLEINALTSCITNTWRNLKQISSRDFANFRWYSLYFFFDLVKHLPIHLPFKAKVGGHVWYKWMYPFERLWITHAS